MTYRSITGNAKPNYYRIDITKMVSKKPAVYQSKFDAKGQKAMAILIDRIRKNVPFDTSIEGANEVYQDLIKSFTRTPNEKGEYLYEDDAYEAPLKSLALRQSTLVDIAEAVRAGFDKVCGALTAPQVKNIKNIQKSFKEIFMRDDISVEQTREMMKRYKEIEKIIGQNIRALREKAGMTQETLAAKLQLEGCDITRSAVAKIEVGQRHLYPDEIHLIKKILNVSYDEIFDIQLHF